MSVVINNLGATTFTSATTGITRTNPDVTTFGSTTAQIKTAIAQLILLTYSGNASIRGVWSSVLTNLIKTTNSSSTNIRGSVINIGGSGTTVKMLGNTLNIDSTFTTILSGQNNMSRVQAGYVTLPVDASNYAPPNFISGGSTSVHMTSTADGVAVYNGVVSPNIIMRTSIAQEVNWLYFI